jgi:hypothetical protein
MSRATLSLGMVASLRCPLPFHMAELLELGIDGLRHRLTERAFGQGSFPEPCNMTAAQLYLLTF